jgi:hypothetical protein
MQSTQEIAELMLDSGRNALLALDIKVSIATLGVGTGALVAGFFGMNVCLPSLTLALADYTVEHPSRINRIRFPGNSRWSKRPRYPSLYLRFSNPPKSPSSRTIRSSTSVPSYSSDSNASTPFRGRIGQTLPKGHADPKSAKYMVKDLQTSKIIFRGD